MTDPISAPLILVLALAVLLIGYAMNYVAGRKEERRVTWTPEVRELPGCMTCRLAAEAGGDWLAKHVLRDHPGRYGAVRKEAA